VLGEGRLWEQPWPEADPGLLVADEVEIPVQVNGKVRDRLHVAPGIADEELLALALASERVQAHVDGRELRKTIVVPDKLVSLVV
jgi:leucyl-tRNA synthetase